MRKPSSLSIFLAFLGLKLSLASAANAVTADPTDLEPIVVKRSAYDSAQARGPVTAVITKEEIEKMAVLVPEDILNYLGVDIQARGYYGIKSDISMNASTFQQVLILVNGARVKDPQTAHQDLDLFFNVEDIERIEIIPAARSSIYGPDGIGGAINFVLKRPEKEKSSILAAGGNHGTYEQELNLSYGVKKAKNRFSAFNAMSEGTRFATDFRTNTFFHSTALEGEDAALYFDAGYNEKEFGAYDFYTPGRNFPSKEWINTKFFDLRGVLKNDTFTFEPRINFRQHYDKFMLTILNPDLYLNHHRTDTYQAGGRLSFPAGRWDMALGADYGEEYITSNNLGEHTRGHWDIYADPAFELSDKTTLHPAVRYDDYTTSGGEVTGSLSLKHAFNERTDVYATAGRTARIPTFVELYYSDPTTAGDPNLKPEHAYNFEAGINRKLSDTLDGSFSIFTRQEYDTIDFTKLTPADPKFIARNISEAFTVGVNAYVKWRATEKMSMDLRYFFAERRIKDNGLIFKYGFSFLRHMISLGIDNELPFGHNRIDFIVKKKPTRREWVLVNDRFSVRVRKDLEFFFEVYNLANVEYQELAGIPEPDRQFKFGTKFSW